MSQFENNNSMNPHNAGRGKAIAALVLGIVAIVIPIPFLDVACGVVGLVLASMSKKDGFVAGLRTAGLVLSIIGTVIASVHTLGWFFWGAVLASLSSF